MLGPIYIERHPSIVAKPVNYAGAEVTGADVKIAPVFDVTGADRVRSPQARY